MEKSSALIMVVRVIVILSLFATAMSAQGVKPKQSQNAPAGYHIWGSDSTGRYQHREINELIKADTLIGRTDTLNDLVIQIGDTTYIFDFSIEGSDYLATGTDNQQIEYSVSLDRITLEDGGLIYLPHRDSIMAHRQIINALTDSINAHRVDIEAHYAALVADIATNASDISANETAINAHIASDQDTDPTNEIQDLSGIRDSIAANVDTLSSHLTRLNEYRDSIDSYDTRITQNADDIAAIDINDADNDPTNELYDDTELRDSIGAHRTSIDSNTAAINAIDINDADSDPQNELITINQVNDTTLNILNTLQGVVQVVWELQPDTVDVLQLGDGDEQQISYSHANDQILLERGGVIDLPYLDSIAGLRTGINTNASDITQNATDIAQNAADIAAIDINDADNDPTNEIQSISRSGNTISISDDASTVDLSPYLDNTDAQDLSLSGNTLSLTGDASTVDLSAYLDDTDTDTQLSQEQVQDYVGSMVAGNTETRIAVTYDDAANEFDFVVDDMTYDDSELRDSIDEHRTNINDIYSQIDGFDFSDDDSDSTNELSTYYGRSVIGDEIEIWVENAGSYDLDSAYVTLSTLNNYLDADSAEIHQILIDSINNVTGIFYVDSLGYRADEFIGIGRASVNNYSLAADLILANRIDVSSVNLGQVNIVQGFELDGAPTYQSKYLINLLADKVVVDELRATSLYSGMLRSDASGNISSTALPPTFSEMRTEISDSIAAIPVTPIGQILTEDAALSGAKTYSKLPAAKEHINRQPDEMNCYGEVAASSSVQVTIRLYDEAGTQRGFVSTNLTTDISHVDISTLPTIDEYDYFQFSSANPTGTVDYMTCNIEFE